MSRYFYVALALVLAGPAGAAELTPEAITSAISSVAADPAKTTAYCAMSKKMEEVGDDEKKAEAAGDEIDGYFKTLGADFEAAWNGAQEASEDSPQSKAFEEAMTKLDDKCK